MQTGEILGHARPKKTLTATLAGERLHHAWLFSGPAGVGKSLLALAFARAMLCEVASTRHEDAPCEACAACRRSASGAHPDLILLRPETERIARKELDRDAIEGTPSREIRIADVRGLERRLRLPQVQGGRSVAIIAPAETMNTAAQNALLKTLEEPPSGAVLLLITDAEGALLPTVRSRCLRLPFGPLPDALLQQEVQTRLGVSADAAQAVVAMSGGSLGRALALGAEASERREAVLSVVEVLGQAASPDGVSGRTPGGADLLAVQQAAMAFSTGRDEAEWSLGVTELYLRDLLAAASGAPASHLRNLDRAEAIGVLGARVIPAQVAEALRAIDTARAAFARNANLRLTLERCFTCVARAL